MKNKLKNLVDEGQLKSALRLLASIHVDAANLLYEFEKKDRAATDAAFLKKVEYALLGILEDLPKEGRYSRERFPGVWENIIVGVENDVYLWAPEGSTQFVPIPSTDMHLLMPQRTWFSGVESKPFTYKN